MIGVVGDEAGGLCDEPEEAFELIDDGGDAATSCATMGSKIDLVACSRSLGMSRDVEGLKTWFEMSKEGIESDGDDSGAVCDEERE